MKNTEALLRVLLVAAAVTFIVLAVTRFGESSLLHTMARLAFGVASGAMAVASFQSKRADLWTSLLIIAALMFQFAV